MAKKCENFSIWQKRSMLYVCQIKSFRFGLILINTFWFVSVNEIFSPKTWILFPNLVCLPSFKGNLKEYFRI